jgi:TusA-related sulfurtransferase
MRFLTECRADASADFVCRVCPIHLSEPAEFLKDMQKGQVLEIITDYDGALDDIPAPVRQVRSGRKYWQPCSLFPRALRQPLHGL